MKTRHLLLGLTAVLTLSLAIPALGGPLDLHGTASLRSLVKKALKTTTSVRELAASAQSAAAAAQSTASGAQESAGAAKGAASNAQSTADQAQGTAERALGTVIDAQGNATETADKIPAAEDSARNVLRVAEGKIGRTIQVSVKGQPPGAHDFIALDAKCPAGTFVSGGGYALTGRLAGANVSEPEGNGWVVEAFAEGGSLTAWALCLQP